MTQPAGDPTCYRHPDRPTALQCSQCGRPICSACSIDAAVGQRCPECVASSGRQRTIDARTAVQAQASRNTPVTIGIIGVTVAIHLLGYVAPRVYDVVFQWTAMSNIHVLSGEWWRMVSVVLLHAPGITHILFNMWALYNLGPQIEREVGGTRFLALYLASAGAGSAFVVYLGSLRDVGVGASGAIFGLFGVWLASAVRRRNTRYGRAVLNQLGVLLVINAAIPFFIPNVAWEAHLGGLIAGFVIAWVWSLVKGRSARAINLGVAVVVLATALVIPQIL